MAGSLLLKEQALVTLTATGASLTTGSAGSAATTLDARTAGNAADFFAALFSLNLQFAATGPVAGTNVADLYLVPSLDGTTYPDVDTTAGTSYIPFTMRVGSFVCHKTIAATTSYTFQSNAVDLLPVLYTAYIINRSGVTINVNWTLKVAASAAQYT